MSTISENQEKGKELGKVIQVDQEKIQDHLGKMVRELSSDMKKPANLRHEKPATCVYYKSLFVVFLLMPRPLPSFRLFNLEPFTRSFFRFIAQKATSVLDFPIFRSAAFPDYSLA